MRLEAGATVAKTGRRDRLVAWLSHHQRIFFSTLAELLANPLTSMMTWLVIGIALGLPLILYVVLQNVSYISGDWGGKPRIALYLAQEVTLEAGQALAREIEQRADIEKTVFVSSTSALHEFQRRSGFRDVLSTLDRNPLPHVIEVVPASPDPFNLGKLVSAWEVNLLVENVSVDLQWLERLFALLVFAERLVTALAIVLCLGVMLIMGNTIRLAIESRRQEIEVIKLVGGTDAFVRRPFLYLGFWYGLGGAVTALFLLQISLYFLSAPVEMLAQSYRDNFALQGPGFLGNLLLLLSGSILGIIGSVLAVSRHLADIEPK
ncbi:permease-like cell division protein FtsX [Gammaproteobacteria bacterium]|nr:permease-like cell division protein FtsX [Gammaproteobacteria bacterium]